MEKEFDTGTNLEIDPEVIVKQLRTIAGGLEQFLPDETRVIGFRKDMADAVRKAIKAEITMRVANKDHANCMLGIATISMAAYFIEDYVEIAEDSFPISGSGLPS